MLLFNRTETQRKTHFTGSHRTRAPSETLLDYGRHQETVGITRLANITGLDRVGIPVYAGIRPNARSLAVSAGKGIDAAAAKASAMMESIEFWHAERIANPLRFESYRALQQTARVVDIAQLSLRPGAKLQADRPTLWIEGWNLLHDCPTWAPFECCSMNTVRPPGATTTFSVTSNGLASGNHILEAVEHALCELIERHATAMMAVSGRQALAECRLDPLTIEDSTCRELLAAFARADLDTGIWDLTKEAGVPTFMVCVMEIEGPQHWRRTGPAIGYGTHLSSAVALSRALTEAAQTRVVMISGSRDDNPHATYAAHNSQHEIGLARRYLFEAPKLSALKPASLCTDTFEGDISVLLHFIREIGINDVVVFDLSRPDVRVPVVKVVAPGLENRPHGAHVTLGARAHARMERGIK